MTYTPDSSLLALCQGAVLLTSCYSNFCLVSLLSSTCKMSAT